jgi:putative cell wall-binding protein
MYDDLSVNVDLSSLALFADVVFVFPWFVYAHITLETIALDTPNNVAVFIIGGPAKRAPTICPISK